MKTWLPMMRNIGVSTQLLLSKMRNIRVPTKEQQFKTRNFGVPKQQKLLIQLSKMQKLIIMHEYWYVKFYKIKTLLFFYKTKTLKRYQQTFKLEWGHKYFSINVVACLFIWVTQLLSYSPTGKSRSERSLAVLSVVMTTLCFCISSSVGALNDPARGPVISWIQYCRTVSGTVWIQRCR